MYNFFRFGPCDLKKNILEFIVYPQPYMTSDFKIELFKKSKEFILKKCGMANLGIYDNIEIMIYNDMSSVVDISIYSPDSKREDICLLHIYFED